MRVAITTLSALAAIASLAQTAVAADLTGAELKALVAGKTLYLETTAASYTGKVGQGVQFFGENGTVLYKTPTGVVWTGK